MNEIHHSTSLFQLYPLLFGQDTLRIYFEYGSSKDGFIPKTSTKVTADGNNLSYEIEVNNSWTGSHEHYYFSGSK